MLNQQKLCKKINKSMYTMFSFIYQKKLQCNNVEIFRKLLFFVREIPSASSRFPCSPPLFVCCFLSLRFLLITQNKYLSGGCFYERIFLSISHKRSLGKNDLFQNRFRANFLHLKKYEGFSKAELFVKYLTASKKLILPPDRHRYECVSKVKNCQFFGSR